ncbi:hypothetical protein MYP_501 [Sporocytophaga myxococcoides]|uniref:Uncharacterized protein n=1 Tax=Sporocytophaga myxococcoides TaxID=153721 RepID=A0A098L8V9_9BACT|nr:hypothetical protein [Sporocytophaga myxococcoides]GAL83275.1 hypothetical protein MYP_501 [Sporocytophaga myxococcoides]
MEKQDPKYELIKNKLEVLETSPDPYAWDKIYDALHKKPVYLKLNRFNNLTIAVSLISIFIFSILYSPRILNPPSSLKENLKKDQDSTLKTKHKDKVFPPLPF